MTLGSANSSSASSIDLVEPVNGYISRIEITADDGDLLITPKSLCYVAGDFTVSGTLRTSTSINTTAGDAATINAVSGRFRKDATGSTFTLTNNKITTSSIILLTYASAPGITGFNMVAVAGSGSAVITFYTSGVAAAPSANTDVNFLIVN
jgi:hypothetical protein